MNNQTSQAVCVVSHKQDLDFPWADIDLHFHGMNEPLDIFRDSPRVLTACLATSRVGSLSELNVKQCSFTGQTIGVISHTQILDVLTI